jgi:hypothetical protein
MIAPQPARRLSTGIPSFDELIEGLNWGECVLFYGHHRAEFFLFLRHLAQASSSEGIPIHVLESAENLDPTPLESGLRRHIVQERDDLVRCLNSLYDSAGRRPSVYCMTGAAPLRLQSGNEGEFLAALKELTHWIVQHESVAYIFLEKGLLSNKTVGQAIEQSALFFDVWTQAQSVFFQPLKAAGRFSESLFMPYQLSDGGVRPATGSSHADDYTRALEKQSREFLELYAQKRQVESDLQRKVFELSLINGLTSSLLSTIELEEILYRILVGVTAKEGLGFNRAFLLLVNEREQVLEGKMAIGPSSLEEAMRIWTDLSDRHLTYSDILAAFDSGWQQHDAHVNQLVKQIRVPLDDRSNVLIDLLMQTQPEVVGSGGTRPHIGADWILRQLGVSNFAATPLVYRKQRRGLLIADNLISQKPIGDDELHILETFANYASTAIEHSRLYEEVRLRIKESQRHISELEAMQNRLMRSKKLSDLGALASKMAHELRTPLVSIGGFANAIMKRNGAASPDYEELKIIVDEVRRLEGIIRNVLTYVSPGIPRSEPTNLQELVSKVLKLMEATFAQQRIEVVTQFANNLPQLAADPEQIQLVLTSVVNNAVESMPDGGRIVVAIQHGHGFLRLSIADTGAGIPKENLGKVFDAFFTTKSLGSGLGLNIASQIVANHKGSIYVESQVGLGSTFFINFPLAAQ